MRSGLADGGTTALLLVRIVRVAVPGARASTSKCLLHPAELELVKPGATEMTDALDDSRVIPISVV